VIVVGLELDDGLLITLRGEGEVIPIDGCESAGRCDSAVPSGTVFYPEVVGTQVFAIYPADPTDFAYDLERVPFEDCGNRVDDNNDGLVDCEDTIACGDSSLCTEQCPEPGAATVSVVSADVATEWADTSQILLDDTCEGTEVGSSDVVLAFDAVAGQTLRVDEVSGTGVVLNITQGAGACSGREAFGECVASTAAQSLEYSVVADDIYYVLASVGPSDAAITLEITASLVGPEDCSTLEDNDDDGLGACDDPDCDGVGECALVCDAPALPIVHSGLSWRTDMPAQTQFLADGGCSAELGGDFRFTVNPEVGDTLRIIEQGAAGAVLNITEGEGACSALLSGNQCTYSDAEASGAGLHVFDVPLASDAARHVHLSSAVASDAGEYDIRAGLIAAGECGLEVAIGSTEESYRLTGTDFQADWPDEVPQTVGLGCFDAPDSVSDAAFTVDLAHGDTVIVQDVTARGGIDHVVNILDGSCTAATSCVYGRDNPIGPGLPEIFSFTRDEPESVGSKHYTVQVTTAAAANEPYDFTVSVLRD
jgi:hypothetical protein